MLLRKKKPAETEKVWSVILPALAPAVHPEAIAQKISQMFRLPEPEAVNIVENAPIVLIENVSETVAENIKREFESTGSGIFITRDESLTRKCSKTLWPDPPDLKSYESSMRPSENGKVVPSAACDGGDDRESGKLPADPDEALFAAGAGNGPAADVDSVGGPAEVARPLAEQMRDYHERLVLAQSVQLQMEESLRENTVKMQELREYSAGLEEKVNALEAERACAGQHDRATQDLEAENERLRSTVQRQEEERAAYEESIREQHLKHARIEKQFLETHREQEEKIASLQNDLDEMRKCNARLSDDLHGLDQSQGQTDETVAEYRKEIEHLNDKNALIMEQYAAIERAVADERFRRGEAEKAAKESAEATARFEDAVRAAAAEAAELREKNQILTEHCEVLDRTVADERSVRQALEESLRHVQDQVAAVENEKRMLTQRSQDIEEEKMQLTGQLAEQAAEQEKLRGLLEGQSRALHELERQARDRDVAVEALQQENQSLASSLLDAKSHCHELEAQHHQNIREANDMFLAAQAELQKSQRRLQELEDRLANREQDNEQMSRFLRERLYELNDCRDQYDRALARCQELQSALTLEKERGDRLQAERGSGENPSAPSSS
jgi:chromosome segregation ATPase